MSYVSSMFLMFNYLVWTFDFMESEKPSLKCFTNCTTRTYQKFILDGIKLDDFNRAPWMDSNLSGLFLSLYLSINSYTTGR